MGLKYRQSGVLACVVLAMFALVLGVHNGAPAILEELTTSDAEDLSVNWLKTLNVEFDLPGKLPELQRRTSLDWLGLGAFGVEDTAKTQPNLFKPEEFDSGRHLRMVLGYTVYTQFGDRFLSGGKPIERTIESPETNENFQSVMTTGRVISYFNSVADQQGKRVVSVMIPLFRANKPYAVAVVDVERTQFENKLYSHLQGGMTLLAALLSAVVLGVLALLIQYSAKRTSAEKDAVFLAFNDPLTGLSNRRQFNQVFTAWIKTAQQERSNIALLWIDVDAFKTINDVYGHHVGDQLLIKVAETLSDVGGSKAHVARLSGDEFAVLLRGYGSQKDLDAVCQRLFSEHGDAVVEGVRLKISFSVGVAVYPDHGMNEINLMKRADMALYRAKSDGRNCFRFFKPSMEAELTRKRFLQNAMRDAIKNGEMFLAYQPQVDALTRRIKGHEALLRWHHPTDGYVAPSEFIPVAEESGFIHELGEWVLDKACREAARWPEPIRVAVNISPAQCQGEGLFATVQTALQNSGLPASRLELEITETIFVEDAEHIIDDLNALRNTGVSIALDDFGTGYSSLNYLSRLPLDVIKIDRSFVSELDQDNEQSFSIIQAVVMIGRSFGIKVLAEGIETEQQFNQLSAIGCDLIQGYLFGRPSALPVFNEKARSGAVGEAQKRTRPLQVAS